MLQVHGTSYVKVVFKDESGQNLNLVKPTQHDGRSHVKNQDSILDFLKCPHILSICHLEYDS